MKCVLLFPAFKPWPIEKNKCFLKITVFCFCSARIGSTSGNRYFFCISNGTAGDADKVKASKNISVKKPQAINYKLGKKYKKCIKNILCVIIFKITSNFHIGGILFPMRFFLSLLLYIYNLCMVSGTGDHS